MFTFYDKDADGELLKKELESSLRNELSIVAHGITPDLGEVWLDVVMTNDQYTEKFKEWDKDASGGLSKDEFIKAYEEFGILKMNLIEKL